MHPDQSEHRRAYRAQKHHASAAVATLLAAVAAASLGAGVARGETVRFPPFIYQNATGAVIAHTFKCSRETTTRMACEVISVSMLPSVPAGATPGTCLFEFGAESVILNRQGRSWVGHGIDAHCRLRTDIAVTRIGDDTPPKALRLTLRWSLGDASKKCQESLALRLPVSNPVRVEWRAGEPIRLKPKCTRLLMMPVKAPASAY